jgi:hypothetical protein
MEQSLQVITLRQLPIIEEHLQLVKEKIEARTNQVAQMAVTEETRADAKKMRTELRKEFDAMETQRKRVKADIMAPYEHFETLYKEYVSEPYKKADAALDGQIKELERGIVEKKTAEIKDYFAELCKANNLDWLKYEQLNLKVGLSTTVSGVKTAMTATVLQIAADAAELSQNADAAELLVEYQKSLNMALALSTVRARHEQIERQRRAEEERRARIAEQKAAEQKVEQAIEMQRETVQPPVEELSAPAPIEEPDPTDSCEPVSAESEQIFECRFLVRGTIDQLKALKQYMEKEKLTYESI